MTAENSTSPAPTPTGVRAAEYVRMSTDQQQFSIAYQQAAIRLYAAQRGMTVTRTYADEGRSGLTLRERPAMIQLLADVEADDTDYDLILVYDVSRWGRYQDADEGAFHEFRCRKAGKHVEYCAEQFSNELSPLNTVLKAIKRAMAAEYSRELAVRTHSAQIRGAALGFLQGGIPGYGLRRMLIAPDGSQKGLIPAGTAKSFRTDRVVLVPGPQDEIDTVRRVFDLFVNKHMFKKPIARILNSEGIPFTDGRPWSQSQIRFVLSNERYVGTLVFGKTSSLLRLGRGHGRIRSEPDVAVHGAAGYEPIVPIEIFAAANEPKSVPGAWYRDAALLELLRSLWQKRGYLSLRLIETTIGMPSPRTYRNRFGTLLAAYSRIGYAPGKTDHIRLKHYGQTRRIVVRLAKKVERAALAAGLDPFWNWQRRTMFFANGAALRIALARYIPTRQNRKRRWAVETIMRNPPHFLLLVRMDIEHEKATDYYCLPSTVLTKRITFIDERNTLGDYRCKTAGIAIQKVITEMSRYRSTEPNALPLDLVNDLANGTHPIRVWRRHRNMTLDQLGEKIGITGNYLCQVETRAKPASRAMLIKLARKLKVPFDDLSVWL